MQTFAFSLVPVKSGIGSAFSTFTSWSRWIGREVVIVGSKSFQLVKDGLRAMASLVSTCWELSKPALSSMLNMLKSSTGLVSLTLGGGLLLGFMALKIEDSSASLSLLALSYVIFGLGLVYGCQAGVIPLLV